MRVHYYLFLNPVVKVLGLILFMIGGLLVHSLQLNLMFLLLSVLLIYSSIEECRKPVILLGIMLCVFLLTYGIHIYFAIPCSFYVGDYNYGTIYCSLWWTTYFAVLYLHLSGIRYSVDLLPFCESLHQTLHFPKDWTYRIYQILLFIEQYQEESKTVQRVYKARGVAVSRYSWRVFSITVKNIKRKLEETELAMQAKGFGAESPSSYYTTYSLEVGDAIYLVVCCLSLAVVLYYKLW